MSIEFQIARRFIKSNRKKGFISIISGISTFGLILAIMSLITVLSVMNGFHDELRNRVLAAISHGYITSYDETIDNWQEIKNKIDADSNIMASSAYVEGYALVSSRQNSTGINLRGVDLTQEIKISELLAMNDSSLESIPKGGIFIGKGLSNQLGVELGDTLNIITPKQLEKDKSPKQVNLKVLHIFNAGVNEFDTRLGIVNLTTAQDIFAFGSSVSGIRVRVDDIYQSRKIIDKLISSLDSEKYYGIDWTRQKANFFAALNLEKRLIAIILSLIIGVAVFNIISMMVMVVTDKTSEIAILRTMGLGESNIVKIFFYQGLIIGITGIVIGVILGLLLAVNIESIVAGLESLLGFKFFPEDIFYINRFPSKILLSDVLYIALGSLVLVCISAIYPAKQTKKVDIAKVLSYE
jgi:lipoprotein-releasing system permease protein